MFDNTDPDGDYGVNITLIEGSDLIEPTVSFDPTQSSTTIDLAALGYEEGDTISVASTGDFDPGGPIGDDDIFQNLFLVNNEGTSAPLQTADGPLAQTIIVDETLTLNILNGDESLSDNGDPDGDYGVKIDGAESAEVSIMPTADASEPAGNGQFTFSLSAPQETDVLVRYQVTGTAEQGVDYAEDPGFVLFGAGQTSIRHDIFVFDDNLLEFDGTITIELTSVESAASVEIGGNGGAQIRIIDNESVPDNILDLYESSPNLSEDSKQFINAAMENAFNQPGDLDAQLGRALGQITNLREQPGNSTDTDLRDAEYYLIGLEAVASGDLPRGIAAVGAPIYNAKKGLYNWLGLGDENRANPQNANSEPGGSAAAYEGLYDGVQLLIQSGDYNTETKPPFWDDLLL